MIERRTFGRLMGQGLGAAALGGILLRSRGAHAESDQAELVRRANITLAEAQQDPQFGNSSSLFRQARAVMIVPQLVKGGFFVGGEGGNGVLIARHGGGWSNPAFYSMGAVSFGLQAGVEVSEVVLFVMSERALLAWLKNEVKLGAQAGLTVLVVGSSAAAAATTNANVDVIAWAKAKGAYAGITLEGSVIKPRNEWNAEYYGRALTPGQILQVATG